MALYTKEQMAKILYEADGYGPEGRANTLKATLAQLATSEAWVAQCPFKSGKKLEAGKAEVERLRQTAEEFRIAAGL